MTDTTHDPIAAADQHLDRAQVLAKELADMTRSPVPAPVSPVSPEVLAAIRQAMGEPLDGLPSTLGVGAATSDPLWVSAMRGRVLAVIASVVSVGTAGTLFYRAVEALAAGPSLEGAAAVATQAATVTDALSAALIAGASLVAMLAALDSKVREWLRGVGL